MSIEEVFELSRLREKLSNAALLNTALANVVRESIELFENGDYDEALADLKIAVGYDEEN